MALPQAAFIDEPGSVRTLPIAHLGNVRTDASAVSWGAIAAGAAAAAALSLVLLILGTGLGLSSVSPWAHNGMGTATFGISTILWVTLTQLLASGMAKASAYVALWLFISLLIGAFVASLAATYGGRCRDA